MPRIERIVRGIVWTCFFAGLGLKDARGQFCTNCKTTIPAGFYSGQTWTKAKSPYCITGDIQVSALTIEPGVTIQADADVIIDVVTTINATGTYDAPIVFTACDEIHPWEGVRFQNTPPGSVLKYCIFEYSDASALTIINSTPAIESCVFRNNSKSGNGGAIEALISSGDLELKDCTIADNRAAGHGGGIRADMTEGVLRLLGCKVWRNRAEYYPAGVLVGGGIYVIGDCEIKNCFITENTCITATTFTNQSVGAYGGGIYAESGDLLLEHSFVGNNVTSAYANHAFSTAYSYGAGTYLATCNWTCRDTVFGCNTTKSNYSVAGGGAFINVASTAIIENSTLARSSSDGLYTASSTVTATNSIFYFNNSNGAQIVGSGTPTVTYSDVQNGYTGLGNINFHPAFSSGCECENFYIDPFSPCVDTGDPAASFDDSCRPPAFGTSRNDMGAHGGPINCEWQQPFKRLELDGSPKDVPVNAYVRLRTTGGFAQEPAVVVATSVNGAPVFFVLSFSFRELCPAGSMTLGFPYAPSIGPITVCFKSVSLDANGKLIFSDEECMDFQ